MTKALIILVGDKNAQFVLEGLFTRYQARRACPVNVTCINVEPDSPGLCTEVKAWNNKI